jgi:hypothetical protein
MDILVRKIERVFSLTRDLIENLSQKSLLLYLGDLPSNKIGEQVWCIIGARESYLKAIKAGKWAGFSCSLQDNTSKSEVLKCLDSSSENIIKYLKESAISEEQREMIFDLLEHEIMHHGQLIRYIYGNKLGFPESWNKRYTV